MKLFCYHDNLKRPRLVNDTVELTKLGILILDEKNGAVEAWGLCRMNILFFPYSSATLPDFKK